MTVFELLKINRKTFEVCASLAIRIEDVRYVELFEEYQQLSEEKHKKTYVETYLCDKYRLARSTLHLVTKRMGQMVDL